MGFSGFARRFINPTDGTWRHAFYGSMGAEVTDTSVARGKFISIAVVAPTSQFVFAAVAGKRVVLLQLVIIPTVAGILSFQSGGAFIFGSTTLAVVPFVLPYSPAGWLRSEVGQTIVMNLGALVTAGGCALFEERDP